MTAEQEAPFWGFGEIFIITALFIVTAGFVAIGSKKGYVAVAEECIVYSFVFLVLRILFLWHRQPLLRSLAWVPHAFSTSSLVIAGLILSVTVILLQWVLRTPEVETPFEKLLSDPISRVAIGLFGVTLGPVIEELLFRGFLQPVLVTAIGVFPGILITSALFGALHLSQNAGMWQSGALIMLVGFVLGVIRHVSGSTRASAVTHIAYNSLPCVALLLQGLHK